MQLPAGSRQAFAEQPLPAAANRRRQEAQLPNPSAAPAPAVRWWTEGLEEAKGLAPELEKAKARD